MGPPDKLKRVVGHLQLFFERLLETGEFQPLKAWQQQDVMDIIRQSMVTPEET